MVTAGRNAITPEDVRSWDRWLDSSKTTIAEDPATVSVDSSIDGMVLAVETRVIATVRVSELRTDEQLAQIASQGQYHR